MARRWLAVDVCLFALLLFCCSQHADAQASFTWFGGANVVNQPNTASWPGSRAGAALWQRPNGDLILFGGNSSGGLLSDLWSGTEDSLTGQITWTLIQPSTALATYGTLNVASASNRPGRRQGASFWLNAAGSGGFLFGGLGVTQSATIGYLNDVWFLDFNTFVWTWIGGSSGIGSLGVYPAVGSNQIASPRSRYYANVAQSGTQVFLFGGAFASSGTSLSWTYLADLFSFDLSTNEFTYLGGKTTASVGTYSGTRWPGGRESTTVWWRGSTIYFAFGFGYTTTILGGYLQEIWALNTVTLQWSVRYGSQRTNDPAVYGSQPLLQSYSTIPGSREDAVGFVLPDGVLIFGGTGYATNTFGWLSDAFLFDEVNSLWIWLGGPPVTNQLGNFNGLGQVGWPGGCAELSRYVSSIRGATILFGRGYGSSAGNGYLNTAWNMTLPASVRAAVNFAAPPAPPLSTGAIVGIAVGSVVGGILLTVLIILIALKCSRRQPRAAGETEMAAVSYGAAQVNAQPYGANVYPVAAQPYVAPAYPAAAAAQSYPDLPPPAHYDVGPVAPSAPVMEEGEVFKVQGGYGGGGGNGGYN